MSVLLFFIDGLGIGTRGPQNPFAGLPGAEPLAIFSDQQTTNGSNEDAAEIDHQRTIFEGTIVPTDAHKQGFPNSAMLEILRDHSIFLQLTRAGVGPITFANTYTQRFFEKRPRWVSATTAAMEAAAVPFRQVADLKAGHAVFHDFTNQLLIERGEDVELRSAEQAAQVLASLGSEHKFTLYEYFITDKIGHKQDGQLARTTLQNLARLIRELLARIDLTRTSVILTSDHGNIEDLSSRNHTLNPVPTIVWGANKEQIANRIETLADITPAIVDVLTGKGTDTNGDSGRAATR